MQGVQPSANGTYVAKFGYKNLNSSNINIPIGDLNKVTPAPLDKGQPTGFLVGTVNDAFRVAFSNGTITWHLTSPDGIERNAKANSKSNKCL
jgi:hypothetical protein